MMPGSQLPFLGSHRRNSSPEQPGEEDSPEETNEPGLSSEWSEYRRQRYGMDISQETTRIINVPMIHFGVRSYGSTLPDANMFHVDRLVYEFHAVYIPHLDTLYIWYHPSVLRIVDLPDSVLRTMLVNNLLMVAYRDMRNDPRITLHTRIHKLEEYQPTIPIPEPRDPLVLTQLMDQIQNPPASAGQ